MPNIGDNVDFTLNGAPANGGGYTYIWEWWDNTTSVTSVPEVIKQMNMGGTLAYSVVQCDALARSHTYNGSIIVNFSPAVIGAPSISKNDEAFPFTSFLNSVSYDPEHPGGSELSFSWYDGGTLIGTGTTTVLSAGTYQNLLEVDAISEDRTLTQIIVDNQNGATRVNYYLRGFDPTGLEGASSSITNSIVSSANNLSQIIIGPGQIATFTAYARDTLNGQLRFTWSAGTLNGWATDLSVVDTPQPLYNGLYKSQVSRQVGTETSGVKFVDCTVMNLSTGQSVDFSSSATLVSPLPPTITSISSDAPVINGGYVVSQAGFVHFSATASDPNNALLSYRWSFSQPDVVLYGRTIMLRPSDYSVFDEDTLTGNGTDPGTGPLPILGEVSVTDRFDQMAAVSLSQFAATLVWPFTQISPQTSGTGSTTLQKRYWGISEEQGIDEAALLEFSSDFSASRNQSQMFIPTNQYIYFVYPAAFGPATINITTSDVILTDWVLTVVALNSVLCNVYRSSVALTGLLQVTIS